MYTEKNIVNLIDNVIEYMRIITVRCKQAMAFK